MLGVREHVTTMSVVEETAVRGPPPSLPSPFPPSPCPLPPYPLLFKAIHGYGAKLMSSPWVCDRLL